MKTMPICISAGKICIERGMTAKWGLEKLREKFVIKGGGNDYYCEGILISDHEISREELEEAILK